MREFVLSFLPYLIHDSLGRHGLTKEPERKSKIDESILEVFEFPLFIRDCFDQLSTDKACDHSCGRRNSRNDSPRYDLRLMSIAARNLIVLSSEA